MSDPFLGEIRLVSFDYAPRGWALCNGQLLSISQNTALFSLLGTYYGGDGRVSFGLPDMRGRAPVHRSADIEQGTMTGEENHTLTAAEIDHPHRLMASVNQAAATTASNNVLAAKKRGGKDEYQSPPGVALDFSSVSTVAGSGQGHANMQPYLVTTFVIALQGIYPSRD